MAAAFCSEKDIDKGKELLYIELGKHWHPSFLMQNIFVFCSPFLLVGVNINTLIPLLPGSGRRPLSH